jgi:predicted nucleic acid-binding protein
MKILIDTDILLDIALKREPHLNDSAGVFKWVESGGEACVAWHSLTNCAYLLKGGGRLFLNHLLKLVEVASVETSDAKRALCLPVNDSEDAFQVAAALSWQVDRIVTRNLPEYRKSPIQALSPKNFLRLI